MFVSDTDMTLHEPCHGYVALPLSELLSVGGEVEEQKDGDDCPSNGGGTFDDEKPTEMNISFVKDSLRLLFRGNGGGAYRHPLIPIAPSRPPVIAPARSPPKAPDKMAADMKTANRRDCSFLLYQDEI